MAIAVSFCGFVAAVAAAAVLAAAPAMILATAAVAFAAVGATAAMLRLSLPLCVPLLQD